MKIFLDTANLNEIKQAYDLGLIDGVTTNPSLIAKENVDFKTRIKEICDIVKGPTSAEVIATTYDQMIEEARILSKISPHVVIKIPLTEEGIKANKILSSEGIKTNLTLIFTPLQALVAAKTGATYVSPFVGRLDDISSEGIRLVEDIKTIFKNYSIKTQIIVASIRHPEHILRAARIGADIVTIPLQVLLKIMKHPLTDSGLETFLKDWEKYKNK